MGNLAQAAPSPTADVDQLRAELRQRDTYIHELHLKLTENFNQHTTRIADLELRLARAQHDAVDFANWLAAAEDEREALRREVAAWRQPEKAGVAAAWRAWRGEARTVSPPVPAPTFTAVPSAPFRYHLRTSPFRVFREAGCVLHGWAFPVDGRPVTALRARVDDREFFGTYGLPEPDVLAQFGPQAENPRPGFKLPIETPPGRHQLSLEARLAGDPWVCILSVPIWARHSA